MAIVVRQHRRRLGRRPRRRGTRSSAPPQQIGAAGRRRSVDRHGDQPASATSSGPRPATCAAPTWRPPPRASPATDAARRRPGARRRHGPGAEAAGRPAADGIGLVVWGETDGAGTTHVVVRRLVRDRAVRRRRRGERSRRSTAIAGGSADTPDVVVRGRLELRLGRLPSAGDRRRRAARPCAPSPAACAARRSTTRRRSTAAPRGGRRRPARRPQRARRRASRRSRRPAATLASVILKDDVLTPPRVVGSAGGVPSQPVAGFAENFDGVVAWLQPRRRRHVEATRAPARGRHRARAAAAVRARHRCCPTRRSAPSSRPPGSTPTSTRAGDAADRLRPGERGRPAARRSPSTTACPGAPARHDVHGLAARAPARARLGGRVRRLGRHHLPGAARRAAGRHDAGRPLHAAAPDGRRHPSLAGDRDRPPRPGGARRDAQPAHRRARRRRCSIRVGGKRQTGKRADVLRPRDRPAQPRGLRHQAGADRLPRRHDPRRPRRPSGRSSATLLRARAPSRCGSARQDGAGNYVVAYRTVKIKAPPRRRRRARRRRRRRSRRHRRRRRRSRPRRGADAPTEPTRRRAGRRSGRNRGRRQALSCDRGRHARRALRGWPREQRAADARRAGDEIGAERFVERLGAAGRVAGGRAPARRRRDDRLARRPRDRRRPRRRSRQPGRPRRAARAARARPTRCSSGPATLIAERYATLLDPPQRERRERAGLPPRAAGGDDLALARPAARRSRRCSPSPASRAEV